MTATAHDRRRAQLRTNARLAGVQALYQMEISGQGAASAAKEFVEFRLGGEGPGSIEADAEFFESLLSGVVAAQKDIDQALAGKLAKDWKLERLDATLRALMRAASFEIIHCQDVPPKVVIDEYVEMAKSFYDGPEPGFVNAALDALARERRDADLNGDGG